MKKTFLKAQLTSALQYAQSTTFFIYINRSDQHPHANKRSQFSNYQKLKLQQGLKYPLNFNSNKLLVWAFDTCSNLTNTWTNFDKYVTNLTNQYNKFDNLGWNALLTDLQSRPIIRHGFDKNGSAEKFRKQSELFSNFCCFSLLYTIISDLNFPPALLQIYVRLK